MVVVRPTTMAMVVRIRIVTVVRMRTITVVLRSKGKDDDNDVDGGEQGWCKEEIEGGGDARTTTYIRY